jgi:uncharacterized membrane protein YbhN (UPF0104 family)
MWWVLRSFDAAAFRAQANHLELRWVAAAVLFDVLSYVLQGYRWRKLLRPVANVSAWRATRAIYAGLFVNELVPMRPGEVLRGLIIARESGQRVSQILPSMVAERFMDGLWLVLAVCCCSFFTPLPTSIERLSRIAAVVCGLVLAALLMARKRLSVRWRDALRNRNALTVSSAVLFTQGLAVWSVLRACHLPWSLFAGMVVMLVVRVGTMLPAAPANLGTHQLSTMAGLSLFGISQGMASSVAWIVFAVLTIPLWAVGLLALTSLGLPLRSAVWGAAAPDAALI